MVQNGDHKCKKKCGAQKTEDKTIFEDEAVSSKVKLTSAFLSSFSSPCSSYSSTHLSNLFTIYSEK